MPGTPVTTTPPDKVLLVIDDSHGDAGVTAPGYVDVRSIEYVLAGDNLRVVVVVAAPPPSRLQARETLGIGVDIFQSSDRESDYQLFADGGLEGWRAFLQTPEGFVAYPGQFAIGGTRLVFDVPFSSIGGRRGFRTSAFADWSSRDGLLPQSGRDRAPDTGTQTVSPSADTT